MSSDLFQERLSELLGISYDDEIIQYALSFQNKRDLEEYLQDVLGFDYSRRIEAVEKCLAVWKPKNADLLQRRSEGHTDLFAPRSETKKKISSKTNVESEEKDSKRKMVMTGNVMFDPFKENKPKMKSPNNKISNVENDQQKVSVKKKASKFVPLYSPEGKSKADDVIVLPGRHTCECAGQKHRLVSNCLECGRIVCEQEGSGPCLFCGNLVCTREEEEVLSRNSRASEKLYNLLTSRKQNLNSNEKEKKGLDEAQALRDKLIEFDRTSARRTKVIDDQADYFSAESKWLSKKQREIAQSKQADFFDKKHKSRRSKTYVLDFAGREVKEEIPDYNNFEESVDDELQNDYSSKSNVNPRINIEAPIYSNNSALDLDFPKIEKPVESNIRKSIRIQDEEIQKISDKGVCLSMHQPWASLLVKGIKQVEGRSWYSPHRGRLWIASTVKVPDSDLINSIESEYMSICKEKIIFPKDYPTSALLGCVDVIDCMSQDDYRTILTDPSESSSPYVFICENPQELFIKLPIKGKHKIWKLDQQTHKAAKNGLIRIKESANTHSKSI